MVDFPSLTFAVLLSVFPPFPLYTAPHECCGLLFSRCVWLFCDSMGCNPPGFCPWDFAGKNAAKGCHFLFQGPFHAQGLTLRLLNCRQILFLLGPQRSKGNWVLFSVEIFRVIASCCLVGLNINKRAYWSPIRCFWGFPGGPVVKNKTSCPCKRHKRHGFNAWEASLEEEMATCSSILAWKIPWTKEPDGL